MIDIIPMDDKEYSGRGKEPTINYGCADTPFGKIFIASTHKGLCRLTFSEDRQQALSELKTEYPRAKINLYLDSFQQEALEMLSSKCYTGNCTLHLRGSKFQLEVWKALTQIPAGKLISYKELAMMIGRPNSFRAVGSAVGHNPVAVIIPCHRVIKRSGEYGNYAYGADLKKDLIKWETKNL